MSRQRKITISTWMTVFAIIAITGIARVFFGDNLPKSSRGAMTRSVSRFQSLNENLRYDPTTRPGEPQAQHPTEATTENSDITKPFLEWQRMTGDWGGVRPKLEDHGLTFDGSLAAYFGMNVAGGANTHKQGEAYLLNVNATLDSKKLLGYEGGTFFLNFRNENGLHNSLDGSFGSTSHLYSPERTEMSEAWYEQKLLDDKLRIRIGKIDANTEFDNVTNGGEFLNDFGGFSPTVLAFPTDPDPAFGVDVFVHPNEHFYAGAGIYDGSLAEGTETGVLGPAKALHPHSEFMIGELGATWTASNGRDGRLAVGGWYHTAEFAQFNGGTQSGAAGPYATFDQMLWRKNPDKDGDTQGIAMFALTGYANPAISAATYQIGGGLKWTGAIPSREDDIIGLGANYIQFSSAFVAGFDNAGEVTIETFYKARLTPWFSVQPDLQFIHNPGGQAGRGDAVAATVQVLIDF